MPNIHANQSIGCLLMGKKVGIEILKNPKTLIDYSQTVDDVYENLKGFNPTRKSRVLILSDNMIADMKSKKKKSYIH